MISGLHILCIGPASRGRQFPKGHSTPPLDGPSTPPSGELLLTVWDFLLRQNSQLCRREDVLSLRRQAFWKFLPSLKPDPTSLQGPPTWRCGPLWGQPFFCILAALPTLTFDHELSPEQAEWLGDAGTQQLSAEWKGPRPPSRSPRPTELQAGGACVAVGRTLQAGAGCQEGGGPKPGHPDRLEGGAVQGAGRDCSGSRSERTGTESRRSRCHECAKDNILDDPMRAHLRLQLSGATGRTQRKV